MASKAETQTVPLARASAARKAMPAACLQSVTWESLRESVAEWDALADSAAEPNPFYESWYLLPSLAALEPEGKVRVLRFEAGGRLAGVMPLLTSPRYYRWPVPNLASWVHDNCFLGAPLVAKGHEAAFWRALLEWADRNAGLALFLHLRAIPLDGPLFEALKEVLAGQKRAAALVHREERAMLQSGDSAEAYFATSLSAKKRKELRRQAMRLGELGNVAFVRQNDDDGLDQWLAQFLALEASGWKGNAGSALACNPATESLFRDSLAGAAQRGRLERLSLTLDGKPVAMLATLMTAPGAYSYKTAFDEAFARYSPGVQLQRENLAVLDHAEIEWTDSCASADHPMIDHIWRERRSVGRISIAIGGGLRRAAFAMLLRAELRGAAGCIEP